MVTYTIHLHNVRTVRSKNTYKIASSIVHVAFLSSPHDLWTIITELVKLPVEC